MKNMYNMTAFRRKSGNLFLALLAIGCLLWMPLTSNAQYLETFSTPNKGYLPGCTSDFTSVNWSMTAWNPGGTCQPGDSRDTDDYFQTNALGVLEANDLDEEVCWQSPLINISAAGTVSLSVDLVWNGFDIDGTLNNCISDQIKVMYSINGGPYTMVPNQFGGSACATVAYPQPSSPPPPAIGVGTVMQGSISGNTLQIRVCVINNTTAEKVTIDNVSVPQAGVTVGCAAPILTTTSTQVGCSNPNSGAINLSVSGGTPPYTYDWNNNGSQNPDTDPQDLSGLPVGTYTVTVTDAASCSATTSVSVTNAPALSLSTQVLGTNCGGTMDGEIDLIVSGGVPGYTYDWSNDGPESPDNDAQDLIGVGTGAYTVTVTDASGCTGTTSATVGTLPATAYLEQFNIANKGYLPNFVDDFSAVSWTMSPWALQPPAGFGRDIDDYFRTSGGVLVGEDFDQEVCWTSPLIGMNTATQFSVGLTWTNFDNEDYINVKYSINGGAYVTMSNVFGGGAGTIQYPFPTLDQSGSTTVTKTALSGTTIQIQVCGNFNSESITLDNVSVPNSTTYCPSPTVMLTPSHPTCPTGTTGSILVTANSGTPGYNVSWSGPSSGNPAGTEIASAGGTYNINSLAAGTYTVTVTDAGSLTATASVTLTAQNAAGNPAFAYGSTGYCQLGSDPTPTIYGTPGGMFSAPGAVSINASTGTIDVSASTVGGPYTITYTTGGPCPASSNFGLSIVNCSPGATLTDALIIDNGQAGKADPGDRIQLTATLTNTQAANYEGVQLVLNNDPRVTFVSGSFKTTPVAVDDAYTATLNTLLSVAVGSGVLQNDFDNGALNVTSFSNPSAQGGTVSVAANGSFTYNPPMGFTGNDTFTYTITDSDMQTNTGTVRIRVQ